MKWTIFLLKRILIFCVVYYSLTIFVSRPSVQEGLHAWLVPKVESNLKAKFPKAYMRVQPKNDNNNYDELWIQYESRKKIEALFAQSGTNNQRGIQFYPHSFFVLIPFLFVFPF